MILLAVKQDFVPLVEYRLFKHNMMYEIDCYVNGQFSHVYTTSTSRSQIVVDFVKAKLGL